MVLLHGLMMNAEYWWHRNLGALAELHRVVALDFRGHGRSGKTPDRHTVEDYADDVHALMEGLGLEGATVVGWSLGGKVLTALARRHGVRRITRAALVDDPPRLMASADWPYPVFGGFGPSDLIAFCHRVRFDRAALTREFIAGTFASPPAGESADRMYAEAMAAASDAIIGALTSSAYAKADLDLPLLTMPVLLVYGARSHACHPNLPGHLLSLLPDALLERFDESGHAPFFEEPERFNAALSDFVSATGAPPIQTYERQP